MTENKQLEQDGARMIASAIIGMDYRNVIVNDKTYIVEPPTIAKIAGATFFLCEVGEFENIHDALCSLSKSENLCKALSWFIQGNDALSEELAQGKMSEIVDGLLAAFSMIEAENFTKLSTLLRSAKTLVAKPK